MALRLARRKPTTDDDDEQRSLIGYATDLALKPVQPFIGRTARRAYLTTFLLIFTGLTLLGFAVAAYILFYWSYIPRIGFERTIHLQFDNVYDAQQGAGGRAHPYPYGSTALATDLVSAQDYDVAIELTLPRTPNNQDAGNFMVEVSMYAPTDRGSSAPTTGNVLDTVRLDTASTSANPDTSRLLARSRRPAIIPYRSPPVDLLYKLTELPYYLLNLRSETASLRIPIFENLVFAKGWRNMPSTLRLELQSSQRLQIYAAKATFRARFQGLRWLMYNHRILSAVIFISTFWTTEMLFAMLAWVAVAFYLAKPAPQDVKAEEVHEVAENIKRENEDDAEPVLSDTERTFPTRTGQQPLRFSSPTPEFKREIEEAGMIPETAVRVADAADDEDEDMDFFDSGLGTSMESSSGRRRDSMRRRRGRLPGRDDDDKFL